MLAIEHAAVLANLLHKLQSSRLDKEPITTRQIEETLGLLDTKIRHLRTTALIREAGALARLQALRSFTDRIIALFFLPYSGDARADQLCGDAVGAEVMRLGMGCRGVDWGPS